MPGRKKFYGAGPLGFQPGKHREHRGTFMHQHKGRVVPKGRKREKDARYAISSRGFTEQHREKKTIQYHSAGYGTRSKAGPGGILVRTTGYHLSAATKAKISKALTGKKHPHKGHSQNASTRKKISESLKKYDASHPAAVRERTIKAAVTRKRNKGTKSR